jgi:uncharacterized protein involved in outer membrane biogenesis
MKKLKWVAIIVVVVIIVGVGVLLLSLDGIIKSVVQTQASSSLNLPTTLGGVHLSLVGGQLTLSDLNIGSPPGFSAPQMVSLGSAGVDVSYGELRDNPVRIDTITLDKPKIVIEQSGGKLNLQALMSQSSTPPPSDSKGGQPMKLIINKLTISNADVSIRPGANIPGVPAEIPITIPSIELQNIGNADGSSNGVAIKDVVMQVLTAIQSKAADSSELPPAVKALLSGNLSQIGDQVKQQLSKSIDSIKSGNPDAVKNAGKDAQNALNGLLGGKKSQ